MGESTSDLKEMDKVGGGREGGGRLGEIKHAADAVVMTSSRTLMTMAENLALEMAWHVEQDFHWMRPQPQELGLHSHCEQGLS